MKSRLLVSFFVSVASLALYLVSPSNASKTGIFNQSKIGCGGSSDCHGSSNSASPNTKVRIWTSASEIHTGDTVLFHLSVINPVQSKISLANAGCNISVDPNANLKTFGTSSGLRYSSSLRQLTHNFPAKKFNGSDTVTYDFYYIAPTSEGRSLIYAGGNAGNGNQQSSGDQWNFTVDTLTVLAKEAAVEDGASTPKIEIYPNPTSGPLVISSQELKEGDVRICDAAGRLVLNQHEMFGGARMLDLSNLANGTYFVTLTQKNGVAISQRISVQR